MIRLYEPLARERLPHLQFEMKKGELTSENEAPMVLELSVENSSVGSRCANGTACKMRIVKIPTNTYKNARLLF